MKLRRELEKIRENPAAYLTEACVLSLGAFLFGFRMTHPACKPALNALAQSFKRPDEADACTRAYLDSPSTEEALRQVLDLLIATDVEEHEVPPIEAIPRHFVELVREPIMSGRTAIVFAEPTVMWCANYWKGFLAGLAATDGAAAEAERLRFEVFENWLNQRYASRTSWYSVIRVFKGADLVGLQAFITLWDELAHSA